MSMIALWVAVAILVIALIVVFVALFALDSVAGELLEFKRDTQEWIAKREKEEQE